MWLLNGQGSPYLAAAQALPPYLADHPERMTGFCLCLDTFLEGDLEGAANINVLRCSRLKNAERESDPSSLGLRFHASIPIYAGDTPLGVLNVASEDWRELQAEELQLLHIIGDQIGLAVQRARLSAEHTHAAARLATIEERNRLAREIHDTLAQGLAAITPSTPATAAPNMISIGDSWAYSTLGAGRLTWFVLPLSSTVLSPGRGRVGRWW